MIARCNVTHLKHVAVFGSGRGRPLEGGRSGRSRASRLGRGHPACCRGSTMAGAGEGGRPGGFRAWKGGSAMRRCRVPMLARRRSSVSSSSPPPDRSVEVGREHGAWRRGRGGQERGKEGVGHPVRVEREEGWRGGVKRRRSRVVARPSPRPSLLPAPLAF